MRVFSTFTGIGGFEVGIQNAYRSAQRTRQGGAPPDESLDRQGLLTKARQGISATPGLPSTGSPDRPDQRPLFVGYSEIDKYACKVYEQHYKGVKNYGDITNINPADIPDFDCLVGGFPCQAFSIAGKRRGFDDTRGTLFFDLARILRTKQPRLFVFENVKGLLSHDGGRTFATIIATIDELGYDAQWQVVNSKDYGVPQNRERVIIVGHLRGTPRPQVFPIENTDRSHIPVRTKERQENASTLRAKIGGPDIDHTYIGDLDQVRVRRLTPLECERLQAFPDYWTALEGMSDTQRYKMCGNAVTTTVIQAVFEKLLA